MEYKEGEFTLERKINHTTSMVYIGRINGKRAIYVLPNPMITEDTFLKTLSSKQDVVQKNGVYSTIKSEATIEMGYNLIYPASEEHVKKYTTESMFVDETYDEYLRFIKEKKHISSGWMEVLIEHPEQAKEKIYHNDQDFMIVRDYKWIDNEQENMHILVIFKDSNLKSIRDIRSVELLEKVEKAVIDTIKSLNISQEAAFLFFHYRPTYLRLHMHVTGKGIYFSSLASAVRAIPFNEVLDNLRMDLNYYKKTMRILKFNE